MMKRARWACIFLVAMALLLGAAPPSEARPYGQYHGSYGHYHGGVWIGAPFLWGAPWWGGYPSWRGYPYGPPPVVIEQQPPVYIQQEPPVQYWYYCQNPQGYYPHVRQCPGGWLQVVPSPPPGR
jgi:hypothetical protein